MRGLLNEARSRKTTSYTGKGIQDCYNGTAGKRKLVVAKVKWSEIECQLRGMWSCPQTNWVCKGTGYAHTHVCTYVLMYAACNAKMSALLSELVLNLMHLLVRCDCRTKHVCCVEDSTHVHTVCTYVQRHVVCTRMYVIHHIDAHPSLVHMAV